MGKLEKRREGGILRGVRGGGREGGIVQQRIKAGGVNGVIKKLGRPVYIYKKVLYPPGKGERKMN